MTFNHVALGSIPSAGITQKKIKFFSKGFWYNYVLNGSVAQSGRVLPELEVATGSNPVRTRCITLKNIQSTRVLRFAKAPAESYTERIHSSVVERSIAVRVVACSTHAEF